MPRPPPTALSRVDTLRYALAQERERRAALAYELARRDLAAAEQERVALALDLQRRYALPEGTAIDAGTGAILRPPAPQEEVPGG